MPTYQEPQHEALSKHHWFNVKLFYSKLQYEDSGGIINPPPDDAENNYRGGIFGDKSKHNKEAQWIKEEEK